MNPLFTLGEEFRFHDSSGFRKKAGDAKLRFYHSFVPPGSLPSAPDLAPCPANKYFHGRAQELPKSRMIGKALLSGL